MRVGATENLLENHGLPWRHFRPGASDSHQRRVIGFDRRHGFDRPLTPALSPREREPVFASLPAILTSSGRRLARLISEKASPCEEVRGVLCPGHGMCSIQSLGALAEETRSVGALPSISSIGVLAGTLVQTSVRRDGQRTSTRSATVDIPIPMSSLGSLRLR